MSTKYKVIAKNGVRMGGKHIAAGTVIDAPKGANIEVAIKLKQIEPVGDTAKTKA